MSTDKLVSDLMGLKADLSSNPSLAGPDLLSQAMAAFDSNAPTSDSNSGTTPRLPPSLASVKGKTGAEMIADLNKVPLFMTELEENDDLDALRALAYEGSPAEVAQGFRERGNESFQERKWVDAKEFYGKGIAVLLAEVRRRQGAETGTASLVERAEGEKEGEGRTEETEVREQIKILEACLSNRAACHLELKNYRSCTLDCAHTLKINPRNIKAFYRSSKALLALSRILEADDACARGLALDPENAALKGVAREIIKKTDEMSAKAKKVAEREAARMKEHATLRAALTARGIKTRKTAQPPEMEDARIQLVPDPADPTSTLTFPAVLLYPLHLESDFVKSFGEMEPLGHHLGYILPLPWDREGLYTPDGVVCYMETVNGGLVKVGKKVTLLKVLSGGSVEIVDEVVKIFVLPVAKAEGWVKEFKEKKALAA